MTFCFFYSTHTSWETSSSCRKMDIMMISKPASLAQSLLVWSRWLSLVSCNFTCPKGKKKKSKNLPYLFLLLHLPRVIHSHSIVCLLSTAQTSPSPSPRVESYFKLLLTCITIMPPNWSPGFPALTHLLSGKAFMTSAWSGAEVECLQNKEE